MGIGLMNRHSWREVKRQLRESGPAGVVAVVLVMIASAWGGALWTIRQWVSSELLSRNRQTAVVAIAGEHTDVAALMEAVARRFPTLAVESLSPRQVQDELARWFPELSTVLLTLDARSFPPIVQVQVPPAQEDVVTRFLRGRPEVTLVESSSGWQARLAQAVSRFFFAGSVLALTLLIGCCAVVLLVVRLLVLNHADEIAIMRLIGAHERDIRRPYLVCGSLLGLGGGVLGAGLLLGLQVTLRTVLPALSVDPSLLAVLPLAGGAAAVVGAALGLASLPAEP
jgi:cell division protein FtsX